MDVLNTVLKAIAERKGENILVYDVSSLTPFLDTMVVASSSNLRQNNAIAANIRDRLKEAGYTGEIRWDTTKPNGTPRKLLDVSKAAAMGWTYKTELEDGIRMSYEDFLNNPVRVER